MIQILWFIGLLVSIYAIFVTVGMQGLVGMFPEGKRWWHLPSQLLSLAVFSIFVLYHPL